MTPLKFLGWAGAVAVVAVVAVLVIGGFSVVSVYVWGNPHQTPTPQQVAIVPLAPTPTTDTAAVQPPMAPVPPAPTPAAPVPPAPVPDVQDTTVETPPPSAPEPAETDVAAESPADSNPSEQITTFQPDGQGGGWWGNTYYSSCQLAIQAAILAGLPIPCEINMPPVQMAGSESFYVFCLENGGTPYRAEDEWNGRGPAPELKPGDIQCAW